jgi:hypothetical protein
MEGHFKNTIDAMNYLKKKGIDYTSDEERKHGYTMIDIANYYWNREKTRENKADPFESLFKYYSANPFKHMIP